MAHWKVCGRLPISGLVLIKHFRQLSWLRYYEQILVEIVVFKRGVGHFEHKFQGEWGIAHQRLLASEN